MNKTLTPNPVHAFWAVFFLFIFTVNTGLHAQNEIPALCYHNIFKSGRKAEPLFISADRLEEHIRYFKENGYRSVLPEDIYNHIIGISPLKGKYVMFSFDDTRDEHYSIAAPLLEKYGFRGTFFIMTVAIGKKHYMTGAQIKSLAVRGHCIANHTYDHQDLRKLPAGQWKKQIEDSTGKLEKITGTDICYFSYPFGACNRYAAENLQKRGMELSFQLSGKQIPGLPLQSQRRLMVSGTWTASRVEQELKRSFRHE